MREIKFRAWIKSGGYMGAPFTLATLAKDDPWKRCDEWLEDDYVIMQFTGLKDVTGKEIYEGDIVRCRGLDTFDTVVIADIRDIPVQVLSWPTAFGIGNGDIEIIGNIHENPELL